jgi:hypothetical protein
VLVLKLSIGETQASSGREFKISLRSMNYLASETSSPCVAVLTLSTSAFAARFANRMTTRAEQLRANLNQLSAANWACRLRWLSLSLVTVLLHRSVPRLKLRHTPSW